MDAEELKKYQTQIEFLNTSQSYLMAKLLTSDEVEIVLDTVSMRLELQGMQVDTELLFRYRDGITMIAAGIEKMRE